MEEDAEWKKQEFTDIMPKFAILYSSYSVCSDCFFFVVQTYVLSVNRDSFFTSVLKEFEFFCVLGFVSLK